MCQTDVPETEGNEHTEMEKHEIEAVTFPNDEWHGFEDGKWQKSVVEQDQQLYRYLSQIGCKVAKADFWEDDHEVCATVYTDPWNIEIELWYCGDLLEGLLRGYSLWESILENIKIERKANET